MIIAKTGVQNMFAVETVFKTWIAQQRGFRAHSCYIKMMLFQWEFSTHISIDFLSGTASLRYNIKWARNTDSQVLKIRFNIKHTVCNSLSYGHNWWYLRK